MVERRATAPFEVRTTDNALGTFSGIASRYDVVDAYRTIMARGCFDRTLSERGSKFPLCWQHDTEKPIGSFDARATDEGLVVDGQFCLETQKGREAYALLKQGAIRGLSIGFNVVDSEPFVVDGESFTRFTDVDLWEASVVTFPACPGAEVTDVRSMERLTRGLDDLDDKSKQAVAEIFEDTAKRIREAIGKTEDEPPKDEPTEEEPMKGEPEEEKSCKDGECENEPEETSGCGKDCKREDAIAILRECRAILARGH